MPIESTSVTPSHSVKEMDVSIELLLLGDEQPTNSKTNIMIYENDKRIIIYLISLTFVYDVL